MRFTLQKGENIKNCPTEGGDIQPKILQEKHDTSSLFKSIEYFLVEISSYKGF